MQELKSCDWSTNDPMMLEYHNNEWGIPVHDDNLHFEFIILDAFQAGLSWRTVLHKRAEFRKVFANFNPKKIAKFDDDDVLRLMNNAGIIRNKQKIQAAIKNAKAFLEIQTEFGTFDKYIWQFVNGKTIVGKRKSLRELPAKTDASDRMSADLKKRGFAFVGSTICYAYMQAAGLVNDHLIDCHRYKQIKNNYK